MMLGLLLLGCTGGQINPANMQTRAQFELEAAWLYAPAGDLRVLRGSSNTTVVVADIGPDHVAEVSRVDDVPLPTITSLAGTDGAFWVANGENLLTYSLENPGLPVQTDAYELTMVPDTASIQSLALHGTHLYAQVSGATSPLVIFDVSDPLHPTEATYIEGCCDTRFEVVDGIGVTTSPVVLWDLTDPLAPTELGRLPDVSGRERIAWSPGHLYIASSGDGFSDTVYNVDINDPTAPSLVSTGSMFTVDGLAWHGGWLFPHSVGASEGGAWDPETMTQAPEAGQCSGTGTLFQDDGFLVYVDSLTSVCR